MSILQSAPRKRSSFKAPKPVKTGNEEEEGNGVNVKPNVSFSLLQGSPVAVTTPYCRVYGADPASVYYNEEGLLVALMWTSKGVNWLEDIDAHEVLGSPQAGSVLTEKQSRMLKKTGDTHSSLSEQGFISETCVENVENPVPYSPGKMRKVSDLTASSTPANASKAVHKVAHAVDVPCGCGDGIICAVLRQKQQIFMAWMRARMLALEIWMESLSFGR